MTPFREVTTGLRFPEGPVAMPDGSLLVVEIERRTLTRVAPDDGSKTVVAEPGGGPNGAAIGPDGAIYVAQNGGFTWTERVSATTGQRALFPGHRPDDSSGGQMQRFRADGRGRATP